MRFTLRCCVAFAFASDATSARQRALFIHKHKARFSPFFCVAAYIAAERMLHHLSFTAVGAIANKSENDGEKGAVGGPQGNADTPFLPLLLRSVIFDLFDLLSTSIRDKPSSAHRADLELPSMILQ